MNALIILAALGVIALCAEIFSFRRVLFPLVLLGIGIAIYATLTEWDKAAMHYFGMMQTDNFALVFILILLVVAGIWFLLSESAIKQYYTEHYAILLFALAGAVAMVSFANLLMLFLGIEILSIAMYVMAGSRKELASSNEAAIKYFILGAFSTGFFLFGIALIYGVTGNFGLSAIAQSINALNGQHSAMLMAGLLLIMTSMAFKIAAFPFHFWAPDVYEGSPDSITAFMASVVKVAAMAAFFRLFYYSFNALISEWQTGLWILASCSILAGNLMAVFQTNLKRMLAFSSIAHAGYMLIAMVAMGAASAEALVFYLGTYALATLAAFSVMLQVNSDSPSEITNLAGLGKKNPIAAACITIALLSLAGIPPAAGFFAKYFLFTTAMAADHLWLVLIAVTGTLISIFYYFRILHTVFMEPDNGTKLTMNPFRTVGMILASVLILILGLFPDLALSWISL